MSTNGHKCLSEDPRIDPASLRGHDLELDSSWPKKQGYPVHLDGEHIGKVRLNYKFLATYGKDAAMAWFRSDSHSGDWYDSPLEAAEAMASDKLLNRCSPDTDPLQEKIAIEREIGRRFSGFDEMYEWAGENNRVVPLPGIKVDKRDRPNHLTT